MDFLIKAVLFGIIWGVTYYWIRRYLNPDIREDVEKYKNDAIYGSIAIMVATAMKDLVTDYVNKVE